eukprot:989275-Pyramimonas_sp.AAC.1
MHPGRLCHPQEPELLALGHHYSECICPPRVGVHERVPDALRHVPLEVQIALEFLLLRLATGSGRCRRGSADRHAVVHCPDQRVPRTNWEGAPAELVDDRRRLGQAQGRRPTD